MTKISHSDSSDSAAPDSSSPDSVPTFSAPVLIIGGGVAGLSMACALAQAGLKVICVDREQPQTQIAADYDGRTISIAAGSRRILEQIGAWQYLESCSMAIRQIRTVDNHSPLFLHFDARDVDADAFGWMVENRDLRAALHQRAAALSENLIHLTGCDVISLALESRSRLATLANGQTIRADLVLACDGRASPTRDMLGIKTRGHAYQQAAIVCTIEHELDHEGIAIEHFMPGGAFAILPMPDGADGSHRSGLVWMVPKAEVESLIKLPQADFDAELQTRCGTTLGKVQQIARRYWFPLSVQHATRYGAERAILVGDAAHAIHPIAGQGLNLGFRDIDFLSNAILKQARLGLSLGDPDLLKRYEWARRPDNLAMIVACDGLVRLFDTEFAPVRLARRLGLAAVNRLPPVKRLFIRHAMGQSYGRT